MAQFTPGPKPKIKGGLLQPVVLNKIGQQKLPTEGGGGRGQWKYTHMPKPGDQPTPKAEGWVPHWINRSPGAAQRGSQAVQTNTPSGQTITIVKNHHSGDASVEFYPSIYTGGRPPAGDFQTTANTFGHVIKAVQNYVRVFKPKSLKFMGASSRHSRLYEKAAPQLAKGLGGTYTKDAVYHRIDLPDQGDD